MPSVHMLFIGAWFVLGTGLYGLMIARNVLHSYGAATAVPGAIRISRKPSSCAWTEPVISMLATGIAASEVAESLKQGRMAQSFCGSLAAVTHGG